MSRRQKAVPSRLGLPGRAEFRIRNVRYEDAAGRIYILPRQDDGNFKRHIELGVVDKDSFEPVRLRRGIEFDPAKEIRELAGRVMMYVQLPPPVGAVAGRLERMRIQMPSPYAVERSGGPASRLILKETASGRLYEAEVETCTSARRSQRGVVLLKNVHALNR
jgi:hypothetical protein